MTAAEYISQRLQKQQKWYEDRATSNKKTFMTFQTIVIVLSSTIPFLVVLATFLKAITGKEYIEGINGMVTAFISAFIAVIASIDKLKQPQTNWFNYRANEEILKKEEWMYQFDAGPYKGLTEKEKNVLLVERVESVISADIARFTKMNNSGKEETTEPPQIETSPNP